MNNENNLCPINPNLPNIKPILGNYDILKFLLIIEESKQLIKKNRCSFYRIFMNLLRLLTCLGV